jgi:hypothetical protein
MSRIFAALLTIVAMAPQVAAAAGGGGQHGPPTRGQWVLMAFYLVNFLIFVWLMRKFTKAPLRDFLASRRKELVEAMAEATKAKAEADRVKKEYEEKVAGLEAARTELIAEIRAHGGRGTDGRVGPRTRSPVVARRSSPLGDRDRHQRNRSEDGSGDA